MIIGLAAIYVAAILLGKLAQRLGQPAVLGELIAGVLLGGSVLGLVDPSHPVLAALATVGVVVLLFGIGLETDARSVLRVGGVATTVAVTGVVLPMGFGYALVRALGVAPIPALVCGAALCATSVGITARVLSDIGRLDTDEGKVILGAAVIDDVIGLAVLAVVSSIVAGQTLSPGAMMIVASFGAGILLHRTPVRPRAETLARWVRPAVVPVFFAVVGAAVDLRALASAEPLAVGAALVACGVLGKVLAGYAPWWFTGDKTFVGIGMMPRGEVGLVFAQMGLAAGAITGGEYGALMLMVLVTTLVTPPALAWWASRGRREEGGGSS